MNDIKGYETFKTIEPLTKGLSGDKKYVVERSDGIKQLLRVADISEYGRKKSMFERMERAVELGVPMPRPLSFGVCNGGKSVYQLLSWCDGVNLEPVLPILPEAEQYALGLRAGEILRVIHSIGAPPELDDWSTRYTKVNDDRVQGFVQSGVRVEGSGEMLRYYEENKPLLRGRPQCFHHGDYHTDNLLLSDKGELSVIDWEMLDYENYADPWEEFNRIGNAPLLPRFTTGMIRGYFGGEPPDEFWRLFAFYLSAGALMLVSWAHYLQRDQLTYATEHAGTVLKWFDNMKNPVPIWYPADGAR